MHQFEISEHFIDRGAVVPVVVMVSFQHKRKLAKLYKKIRKRRKKVLKILFGRPKRAYKLAPDGYSY